MRVKWLCLLFTMISLMAASLSAGTTGKIAGRITDESSGEGLPGVEIQIVNTQLGGTTDLEGYFVILNVPPGLHTLNLGYLGYKTVIVRDVRVNVDFTTRIEQKMATTVIQGETEEVIGERNPLVRQDLTNTTVAVSAEQIESLPVDQIRDVIALQAGIVEDNSGALHIRGGRSNEVSFQVNGLSINNPYGNSQGVGLATNAVQEVSVSTGTFSAEYGNALSGVINFVTKDGGDDYDFSLRAWTGDNISSRDDIFFNIDEVDPLNNARAEWTLGGPIPLLGNKLTFFSSGVYQEDDGHLYGIRVYNPEDRLFVDGDQLFIDPRGSQFEAGPDGSIVETFDRSRAGASGDRAVVPLSSRKSLNLTGKLTLRATPKMKFSYDFIMDDGEVYSSSRTWRFTPDGRPKTVSRNISHSIGLTHTLSDKLFYTLKLGVNFNNARTSVFEDPLDQRYVPALGNSIANMIIPPTGTYIAGGMDLNHTTEEARSLIGKLDFVHQILPNHELRYGGEAAQHRLNTDAFTLLFDEADSTFIIPNADINPDFTDYQFYEHEPVQAAFYILDKMELAQRFILNAGFRYEYLDTKAVYNPDLAGTVDSGVADPSILKKASPKHRVAPRISLSFPITAEGIIRFSYGTFYQNPTFRNIYTNTRFEDFDFVSTPTFGNTNLAPQKSIQYEVGLQQQFSDNLKIDLTLFYKDVTDLIQFRRVVAGDVAIDKEFNVLTSISYANVRGVTASLLKRRAQNGLFSATLDYTYQIGEGAFTDPLALAIDTRTGRETEQKYIPLDFDRTHTLNGTMTLHKDRSWLASVIGRVQTGTPYTPSVPSSISPVQFEENSDRRPLLTNIDLKLTRFFDMSDVRLAAFVQVENVLDILSERFIHSNTGRSLTNLNETFSANLFNNLRETIADDPGDFFPVSFLDNFYQREDWLGSPREIRFGLSFDF